MTTKHQKVAIADKDPEPMCPFMKSIIAKSQFKPAKVPISKAKIMFIYIPPIGNLKSKDFMRVIAPTIVIGSIGAKFESSGFGVIN
jgi:hypothetical protein